MLTQAEELSSKLSELLRDSPIDTAAADAAFKQIAGSCAACHAAYRD